LIKYVIKSKIEGMNRTKKGGKKGAGGAGGQPPAGGGKRGVEGATNDEKGQELVVAGSGLARGDGRRALTALEFQGLAAVPAEAEWFANIDNPRTRRAYRIDIHENKVLFHTYLVTYFLDFWLR
jgi:hypothetical protein